MRRTGLVLVIGLIGVGVSGVTSSQAEPRSAREIKGGGVQFHLASTTPITGYEKVASADGTFLYVGQRPVWNGKDVVSARTMESRDGAVIEMTLSAEATERLATLRKHRSGDRVAIYVDGSLLSSGLLGAASSGGRATITGLDSTNTESVLRLLNGESPVPAPGPNPSSPMLTMETTGPVDGVYLIDVFVQGVRNLRSYQIGLLVEGGSSGELMREEVVIDNTRPDFVYGQLPTISAADEVGGRLMGVLINGSVERNSPAYLGTYAFRPSPDAAGVFEIKFDTETKSLMQDGQNATMQFRTGPPALIAVGEGANRRSIR